MRNPLCLQFLFLVLLLVARTDAFSTLRPVIRPFSILRYESTSKTTTRWLAQKDDNNEESTSNTSADDEGSDNNNNNNNNNDEIDSRLSDILPPAVSFSRNSVLFSENPVTERNNEVLDVWRFLKRVLPPLITGAWSHRDPYLADANPMGAMYNMFFVRAPLLAMGGVYLKNLFQGHPLIMDYGDGPFEVNPLIVLGVLATTLYGLPSANNDNSSSSGGDNSQESSGKDKATKVEFRSNKMIVMESRKKDSQKEAPEKPPPAPKKIPVVPTLDKDGPLPPDAYHTFGREEFSPKPTCALSVAINLDVPSGGDETEMDPKQIVQGMQQCIDSGLTSFHLGLPSRKPLSKADTRKAMDDMSIQQEQLYSSNLQAWGEENVYGLLKRMTPSFAMDKCHLTVPLATPSEVTQGSGLVTRNSLRESITESLSRIGTDSIDTLQLEYCEGSPYHLEIMDHLVDLQREGLIRSIAGSKFPPSMLRSLYECGFRLDSNQVDCNILTPNTWNFEQRLVASDLDIPHVFSHPLAGGLLTNRFENQMFPPLSSKVGREPRQQYTRALWLWSLAQQNGKVPSENTDIWTWQKYQKDVLPPLLHIALKYNVDVAAVALRWLLQLEGSRGALVGCNMMNPDEIQKECVARRLKSWRNTFRFELDEEDMERLNKVGVLDSTESLGLDGDDLGEMMSNKKLWL